MDRDKQPLLDNPSLVAVANAYRRVHGVWPERARFSPVHFADMAASSNEHGLVLLGTAIDLLVTTDEPSPRVTVSGRHGESTYDEQVTESDWDDAAFLAWLQGDAEREG